MVFTYLIFKLHLVVDFVNRQASCDEFNVQNRWKKRAIAAVPMRWPAQYNGTIPAFVTIYHWDGTVAVSHGGVECGQGINTKVAQVAAFALGVPLESISVRPIDDLVSANSTLTGSSTTSEMSCYVSISKLMIYAEAGCITLLCLIFYIGNQKGMRCAAGTHSTRSRHNACRLHVAPIDCRVLRPEHGSQGHEPV